MLQAGWSQIRFPGKVIEFFNLLVPYPSSSTMASGSNKSLTEMSNRNLPGEYNAAGP
jgi:hypothetical protein